MLYNNCRLVDAYIEVVINAPVLLLVVLIIHYDYEHIYTFD